MSREIKHLIYLHDAMRENYFRAHRTDTPKKVRAQLLKAVEELRKELHGALDVLGLNGLMSADVWYADDAL